ncbi:MAG: hypothetical protein AMK69_24765 [Nitrospira bacterium SG8_3]|nr:MAG: hypothetical protein AMK69_24765 [Nitrospira bacterium SG8_3]
MPNLDKPEPKKQNYHETTKGHESTKKRFPEKISCLRAFVVVFLFSARKSMNSMTNGLRLIGIR